MWDEDYKDYNDYKDYKDYQEIVVIAVVLHRKTNKKFPAWRKKLFPIPSSRMQ